MPENLYYRILLSVQDYDKETLLNDALEIFCEAKKRRGKLRETMKELQRERFVF